MDNKVKTYVSIAIVIAIFVFAYAAVSYVNEYSKAIQPSSFRSFSISGEGKVVAVPNIAQFSFSVITEGGKNIADLQKTNIDKTNKAIEFVKSKGVESKDIQTQSYNLTPRYQYSTCTRGTCPPAEIVGYTISQTVLVKIRAFDKIGDILSGVITSGANSVSQLSFTIDDPSSIQNQARIKAIQQAKEKAMEIAKATGFRLGRLLAIDESNTSPYRYDSLKSAVGLGVAESSIAPAPSIEPGSQDVTIDVTLKYEIK